MSNEKRKKKVLMYYSCSTAIGGPLTYINTIINSNLSEEYDFTTCFQEMAPKGINIKLMINMIRKIKLEHPDIVHVHGLQSEGFYGALAARMAGCKNVLMTVHGFAFDSRSSMLFKRILYRYFVEPLTIRLSSKIYTVCDYAAKRKIMVHHAKNNNCGCIHNTVSKMNINEDADKIKRKLNINQNEIVFAIAARVTQEKGFDVLAKAIKIMNSEYTNKFKMLVMGDGAYYEEFVAEMKAEIGDGQVIMIGQTEHVEDYLNVSDVFVLPSYHENFPIALLEAGKMGLPCITSAVGGVPEMIIDGKTGFLITNNDPKQYARKMNELIVNRTLLNEMKENILLDMEERFSLSEMCKKIGEIYECMENML